MRVRLKRLNEGGAKAPPNFKEQKMKRFFNSQFTQAHGAIASLLLYVSVVFIFAGIGIGVALAANVVNFKEQGGARWVVGGSLDVISGGDLDIESGGALKIAGTAVTSSAAELNLTDGITATTTELNETFLTVEIADISTASSAWVVSPHAGTVTKIYSIINGTIATADAVLDPQIGGTSITDGGITIEDSGSAAGDIDSSTPSALNIVTAGQAIEIATAGASTNTISAVITLVITR